MEEYVLKVILRSFKNNGLLGQCFCPNGFVGPQCQIGIALRLNKMNKKFS